MRNSIIQIEIKRYEKSIELDRAEVKRYQERIARYLTHIENLENAVRQD